MQKKESFARDLIRKVVGVVLVVYIIYLVIDIKNSAKVLAQQYVNLNSETVSVNKADFLVSYKNLVESQINLEASNEVSSVEGINISKELFTDTCIRLNTEIYEISKECLENWKQSSSDVEADTELARGYVELLDPLMYVALTVKEMESARCLQSDGSWRYVTLADKKYTWTPAVYSTLLSNAGVDMDALKIAEVDSDTYINNGLKYVMYCGEKCDVNTAKHNTFWHQGVGVGKFNDNDSLGPCQVRRKDMMITEENGTLTLGKIECGNDSAQDLMSWKDNIMYMYWMKHGSYFCKETSPVKDTHIDNRYQLMAMIGVAHNTGAGYLSTDSQGLINALHGSGWRDNAAIIQFCKDLTTPENLSILQKEVDEWYEREVADDTKGENSFNFLGSLNSGATLNEQMQVIGIKPRDEKNGDVWLVDKLGLKPADYVYSSGRSRYPGLQEPTFIGHHKMMYALNSVLNYMCLEKLYTSGAE